ncbi:MAG TPA: LssY C-terminal domain-containing protein [Candidatus Binatia bacterium]|nr:LssY C-terminal domain-containing protein [Candidatus Binatia bacterium]
MAHVGRSLALVARIALAGSLAGGCATFRPQPLDRVGFLPRALTKSDGGLVVSAAALGGEESRQAFDADLAAMGIQPVWLEIRNGESEPYILFPIALDPDYFSPLEVAWKSHRWLGGAINGEIDRYFYERRMPLEIDPGETARGFVFTNLDLGRKPVNVVLVGDQDVRSVPLTVPVPGLRTDRDDLDLDALYRPDQVADLDLDGLRRALVAMPCCTTDARGSVRGDPLNLAVVGTEDALAAAFAQRGWDDVETLHTGSALATVRSFLFGTSYRYSPVSPLYVFGRRQDLAFQKARATVHERNHLRLWRAPLRWNDLPVWVGQISRDVGVRWTSRTWNLTTHAIDPDVDEARTYLVQDLVSSERVAHLGFVSGVGRAAIGEPRSNLTGDPYFTDGLRAVFVLTEEPVSFRQIDILPWDEMDED